MIGRFHEISIRTDDIRQSVEFYEQLGFRQCVTGDTWSHPYGVLTDGAITLGLHQYRFPSPSITCVQENIPEHLLQVMAGLALWFLAFLVWLRTRLAPRLASEIEGTEPAPTPVMVAKAGALGVTGGIASAFFGVGMAPFIQLGMLTVFRLSLVRTIGTTMLALIFISLSGSLALARHGDVSVQHLIGATIGMMAGTYVGAKMTRRAPLKALRIAIVATPFVAGTLLVFG